MTLCSWFWSWGNRKKLVKIIIICNAQNLVPRDYSKRIHTHTHTHKHTQAVWPYKAKIYTAQNRQQTPGRPGTDEDISMEQKTWQAYNFGKRNVFRLDMNESRQGFCQTGRVTLRCLVGLTIWNHQWLSLWQRKRGGWGWGLKPEVSANRRCKGVGQLSSKHSWTLTSGHTYINH